MGKVRGDGGGQMNKYAVATGHDFLLRSVLGKTETRLQEPFHHIPNQANYWRRSMLHCPDSAYVVVVIPLAIHLTKVRHTLRHSGHGHSELEQGSGASSGASSCASI